MVYDGKEHYLQTETGTSVIYKRTLGHVGQEHYQVDAKSVLYDVLQRNICEEMGAVGCTCIWGGMS